MKRFCITIFTTFFSVFLFAQASEPVTHKAALVLFEKYYNQGKPDSIFKYFSAKMKAALPSEKFNATTNQLKSQIGNLVSTEFSKYNESLAVYKATFEKGTFLLNLSLNSNNQFTGLLLSPYQNAGSTGAINDPSITESPVVLKTLTGLLSGTLAMPNTVSGKVPVVLIIAGSGPIDRNGNSTKLGLTTNTYKEIAEVLGKNGIASLRYDKRMVGESGGPAKEDDLRFDDYTDDAIGFIKMLKADERFSKVIVLGHSEGSLVGILACGSTEDNVSGFISAAGAGESAEKILIEQMKSYPTLLSDGFNRILDSLRMGKVQKKVDPQLYFIIRPSIQMYVMTWCRFDPQKEIKKLKMPVLIVQGTSDLQVSVAQAEKLKKGRSGATLTIIPGMNHILKDSPDDKQQNLATYTKPDLPLKPEFVNSMLNFIKGLK